MRGETSGRGEENRDEPARNRATIQAMQADGTVGARWARRPPRAGSAGSPGGGPGEHADLQLYNGVNSVNDANMHRMRGEMGPPGKDPQHGPLAATLLARGHKTYPVRKTHVCAPVFSPRAACPPASGPRESRAAHGGRDRRHGRRAATRIDDSDRRPGSATRIGDPDRRLGSATRIGDSDRRLGLATRIGDSDQRLG